MRFDEMVVQAALRKVGTPYIWAGKGDYCVRDGRVLRMPEMGCDEAFDCSGLVTWAVREAGGPDLRATWGAARMWQELPDLDEEAGEDDDWFALALYGTKQRATHVALELGRGLLLDASGGDSATLTLKDALNANAFVRVHLDTRKDLLGYRSLVALRKRKA